MRLRLTLRVATVIVLTGAACPSQAADPVTSAAAASPVVVLDTTGFWRMYHTLKPPVVQLDEGLKPALTGIKWLDWETDAAPADWAKADFDDSSWARLPLRRAAITPYLARLCLRGKFRVTDPAKVKGLKLWVDFHGGAIVYVNGQEVARASLPAGQAELAEGYPEQVFVTSKGGILPFNEFAGAEPERQALRVRKLGPVAIPASSLRGGVNVLAIEIIRAPYNKIVTNFKPKVKGASHPYDLNWPACHIERVQLAADTPDGLTPNCVRPRGFQVWNSDTQDSDFDLDFGDTCETLRPIHLVGVRNGAYSGKVVLGSDQPMVGLKATASDLKSASGTIPASAVRLRYGLPWGDESPQMRNTSSVTYAAQATALAALAESPPAKFPVLAKPGFGHWKLETPNQPALVFGAVTSLWATVKVPLGAKPGVYKGEITIAAEGQKPVRAPLEIKVLDWTLPDTQNYRVWTEFFQSPETLEVEYGVKPWSDQHWAMIAQAFRYFGETSSRVVYVPVIAHSNLGNDYSMVRWIRKPDGQFDFDFSIMDKYLDTAIKNMGPPKIVCFPTWEIYLIKTEIDAANDITANPAAAKRRQELQGKGPLVTVLDPATGRLENINLPPLASSGTLAVWKSLFDQLRARLKARGLEDTAAIGFLSDAVPTKEETQFLIEATGDLPWVSHSHHGTMAPAPAKTLYRTHVFGGGFFGVDTSNQGWKGNALWALYQRGDHNTVIPTAWRHFPEAAISGAERGIGRLGGDYWPAIKDKNGRRVGNVSARYPESAWRNLELLTYFLAPGSAGPVATTRFETLREGLQDCEARIYLETALTDKVQRAKLGDDLAARVKETLDERLRYMWKGNSNLLLMSYIYNGWAYPNSTGDGNDAGHSWFLQTRWPERSEKLYALAGEVQKTLAAK